MADPVQFGSLWPNSGDGTYNKEFTRVQAMLMSANTCIPVIVNAVRGGGVSPVGYVDCTIAILQTTGGDATVENATLSNVPFVRIQGGSNAVIIDPAQGDIGLVCFCQRDISSFKSARRKAPPGSRRTHSISDGVYIGGILNAAPYQYIMFDGGGITIVSPTAATANAPQTTVNSTTIKLNGNVEIAGDLKITGSADMAGVTFNTHVHTETGSVTNGPRNP